MCSEDGCDRAVVARGLCARDYQRWRAHRPPGWSEPPREKPKCLVSDCPRRVRKQEYCNRHYENLRRYGNPVPQRDRPLEARLRETGWTVTASGCWEWNGKRNDDGYGLFSARRLGIEGARAHRVVYECLAEAIPDGLLLRHKCDNPPCVNPDHLIPGTDLDNAHDMVERGRHFRHGRARCDNGHDLSLPGARTNRGWCAECDRARKRRYEERHRPAKRAS
jgi:hypothetical protein